MKLEVTEVGSLHDFLWVGVRVNSVDYSVVGSGLTPCLGELPELIEGEIQPLDRDQPPCNSGSRG